MMINSSINTLYKRLTTNKNFLILIPRCFASTEKAISKKTTEEKYQELNKMQHRPLYLDSLATTPLDPRVLDSMLPYLTNFYGNPHSRTHSYGWETEKAVEIAREQVASLINADPKEIIFTSGATESNNIAIKGVGRFYKDRKKHIITSQIDHKCVLDSCRALESEGFQVTYLPVQSNGRIDIKQLEKEIRPDTSLVSIMAVNNEIGVIQSIEEIGKLCRSKQIFFHTDAAQAVGKIPIDVNKLNIDLMSISGHKLYGPKGIGALYVRRKPRVRLEPVLSGGGQERGLRSGTLPAPLCVGLGVAAKICKEEMQVSDLNILKNSIMSHVLIFKYDHERVKVLSKRLIDRLQGALTHIIINGDQKHSYPGCVNISFSYVEGESLLMACKDIALSSGSACTSASLEPSYVLRALGVEEDLAHSSIRFGINRFTTEAEVDYVADTAIKHVNKLRAMRFVSRK